VSAGHQLQTGDTVYISGADQSDYNGEFEATVTGTTTFTFSVASTATSPATGTIVMYPPYSSKHLPYIDFDKYRQEGGRDKDNDLYRTEDFSKPEMVVRKPDNNFIISPKPDRIYTVQYEFYGTPTNLSAYTDEPIIPEFFENVILDGAIVHGYFFRDNIEQTAMAKSQYEDKLVDMRRILIPMQNYMRISN
jgi:hypothetical protein